MLKYSHYWNLVIKKIKEVNIYVAVFLKNDSDGFWLTDELAIAKSENKKLLIYIEQGTPEKNIGKIIQNHPIHYFTMDTFVEVVNKTFRIGRSSDCSDLWPVR